MRVRRRRVTLLIDPPNSPGHGRLWSHLASDTSYDELHAFAARIGVPSRAFHAFCAFRALGTNSPTTLRA